MSDGRQVGRRRGVNRKGQERPALELRGKGRDWKAREAAARVSPVSVVDASIRAAGEGGSELP